MKSLPDAPRYVQLSVRHIVLLLFVLVLLSRPGRLSAETAELDRAVTAATERRLAHNPQWRTLLHCQSEDLSRCDSAVRSADFFSSPEAVDDPTRELAANVRSIFVGAEPASFQCRYPARFDWLRQILSSDGIVLPETECPELDEWVGAINPHAISLIFPSSFLNNPASAFGHTLLRIDQPGQDDKTRLVAYTANFAAHTEGDNALLYAYRGVFGGYHGFFSVAPYYDKVKKYSDLEDRDIWEYELNFTPDEVRRLTLHVWELKQVPFSYFYFDDNCSYQLLSLLEVARPTLAFKRRFGLWVLPVDTARSIMREEGLFRRSVFRPSLATKLAHAITNSSIHDRAWALDAADPHVPLDEHELSTLSPDQRIARLDLAYDTLTYRTLRGSVEGGPREARAWKLLSLRSAQSGTTTVRAVPSPAARPDEGHGTARISIGAGHSSGRWFTDLGVRPAFHDQLDPASGYLRGAQIGFLDTTVRYEEERGAELQRLTLLDIESLSARDAFFTPKSWSLRLGADRYDTSSRNDLVYSFEGAAGASVSTPGDGLLFGLLEAEVQSGSRLDPGWAFGAGPRSGLILQVAPDWRLRADAGVQRFFTGDEHTHVSARVAQSVSVSRDDAIRVTVERAHVIDDWETSAMVEWLHYFDPMSDR